MGYQLGGWADFPVELRFILEHPDQFNELAKGLQDPMLVGAVSMKTASSLRESLGGVVAGQMESTIWLHVSAPVDRLSVVMSGLFDVCNRVFPRVRGNDGEGSTDSY